MRFNRIIKLIICILFFVIFSGCESGQCEEFGSDETWSYIQSFCNNVDYFCGMYSHVSSSSGCSENDIEVLNKMMESNYTISEFMDCNSNGIIDPQEFGKQVWENGRLTSLNIGFIDNVSTGDCSPDSIFYPVDYIYLFLPNNLLTLF